MREIYISTLLALRLVVAGAFLGLFVSGCGADADPMDMSPGVLAAPTALTATAVAGGVHLTWQDNATGEDEFMVLRRPAGGALAQVGSAGANATMFHDTTVSAGTTYSYVVHAMSATGQSGPSNEATVTLP
jgi:hypothetical protein